MWSELEARNWWRMRHTDGIVSLSKSGYADVAIGRTFFSSLPCKGEKSKPSEPFFPRTNEFFSPPSIFFALYPSETPHFN